MHRVLGEIVLYEEDNGRGLYERHQLLQLLVYGTYTNFTRYANRLHEWTNQEKSILRAADAPEKSCR